MIQIKEIVNSIFTSKTYILYRKGYEKAWLVDIGDVTPVVSFLKEQGLKLMGVFLTHAHFDHIYGLPELVKFFPEANVYVSAFTKIALASEKLNMSKYHESPLTYSGDNVTVVHEGEAIELFEGESKMLIYETPGHNPGCLTMALGDWLFTGDSYIPGIEVVTNFPRSNKKDAQLSLNRIVELSMGKIIYPGHKVLINK